MSALMRGMCRARRSTVTKNAAAIVGALKPGVHFCFPAANRAAANAQKGKRRIKTAVGAGLVKKKPQELMQEGKE